MRQHSGSPNEGRPASMKRQRSTAELEAPGPAKKGAQKPAGEPTGAQAPTEEVQQKPAEETQRKPTGEAQQPAEEAQKEEEPPLSQGSSLSATTLPWPE